MGEYDYDYASSYSIVYSIVYQFGTAGLEIDQIKEFSNLLSEDTFQMIADKWVSILFDKDFNMKESSQLVMNQRTKRLVAIVHIENSSDSILEEEYEEEIIIQDFVSELEDISPEDFLD
jgi:hypothetical protein